MPRRGNFGTRRPRKTYRKRKVYRSERRAFEIRGRRKGNSPSTTKWLTKSGTPDQLFCKLKYVQTFGLAGSAGILDDQVFQSSGFDPDQTGAGHQPRYWDQVTALYGRYQVLAMKVRYSIVNINTEPIRVVHSWTDSSVASATAIDAYAEAKYATIRTLGGKGGKDTAYITSYMSAKKIHGQGSVTQQDDMEAVTTANPVDMFYSNVIAQSVVPSVAWACSVQAEITYYFRFFESLQSVIS